MLNEGTIQQQIPLKAPAAKAGQQASNRPFYLVLVYLILEYARPQSLIKPLEVLHMSLIVGIFLIISLAKSGPINFRHTQTKLYIILLLLMTVHIPFAVNNFWAFQNTQTMAVTFVAYLSIIHFVDTFKKFKTMMAAWIWIHIFLGIMGIAMGGKGIGGFMGDENDFALVLNMAIPFAFFMAMAAKTVKQKVRLLTATGLLAICVTATLSRGGFLGLVCVAGFCWLKSPRKVVSLILAVLLLFAVGLLAPESYWDEVKSIADEPGNETGTGAERLYSWGRAWEMFLDNPIFGVGPGNFNWNFQQYEPPEGHRGRHHGGRAAHSLYFTILPELGTAGLILFLLMLKAGWEDRRDIARRIQQFVQSHAKSKITGELQQRADDYEQAKYFNLAIAAAVVAYLITGTFISVLYYPSFWLLLAFGIALRNAVIEMDGTTPPPSRFVRFIR